MSTSVIHQFIDLTTTLIYFVISATKSLMKSICRWKKSCPFLLWSIFLFRLMSFHVAETCCFFHPMFVKLCWCKCWNQDWRLQPSDLMCCRKLCLFRVSFVSPSCYSHSWLIWCYSGVAWSMVVDNGAPEATHAGAMSSEMVMSPSSAASSNHAPFTPSEIPGMAMDTSVLDSAFGSDMGNTGPLQLGPDGSSRDSIRSLGQLWNFSLSDLTADLTSLGGDFLARVVLPYLIVFLLATSSKTWKYNLL